MAAACTSVCTPKSISQRTNLQQLPGVPGAFFMWIKQNPGFLEEMFAWQRANRHLFQGPTEEFPIGATVAHNNLMLVVDRYLGIFLTEQRITEDDFSNALESFQESSSAYLKRFFSLIVKKMDFMHWATLVRNNTCLCCGGGFCEIALAGASYDSKGDPAGVVEELDPCCGWAAHRDPATGNIFYQNLNDGSTTWDRPSIDGIDAQTAPSILIPTNQGLANQGGSGSAGYSGKEGGNGNHELPPGWTAHTHGESGRIFYSHVDGTSTWDPPVA